MKYWLAIVLGSMISVAVLWWTDCPLGIPGEWAWERTSFGPDFGLNLVGAIVAATLYLVFVMLGQRRFDAPLESVLDRLKATVWLCGLVIAGFIWLWVVQETAPEQNRLGKAAFVLYYPNSSGYFTRARYEQPDVAVFLTQYETLMREGDVLHTGTHPPGLFLVFHGLIAACDKWPTLARMLDDTRSASFSFGEACEIIASNALRMPQPHPVRPLDCRVLWLATLLVMACASLAVLPLYGLLRRGVSPGSAWTCAALWPAVPAVAVFIPKSDVVFPLVGLTFLLTWLTAWDRRSILLALFAGLIGWCGLICSLAILPVMLAASLMTVGRSLARITLNVDSKSVNAESRVTKPELGTQRCLCLLSALLGLAIPTLLLWHFTQLNLLNVLPLNYQNHAGFYQQYVRTYWKWLLVNPVELSFAVGFPISLLAITACWNIIRQVRNQGPHAIHSEVVAIGAVMIMVWTLLWLTGKNSGEAARLWILLMPWSIWLAGYQYESITAGRGRITRWLQAASLLGLQLAVCLLTVFRVSGFHLNLG